MRCFAQGCARYAVKGRNQRWQQTDPYVQIPAALVVQHDVPEQVRPMGRRHEGHVPIHETRPPNERTSSRQSWSPQKRRCKSLAMCSLFWRARGRDPAFTRPPSPGFTWTWVLTCEVIAAGTHYELPAEPGSTRYSLLLTELGYCQCTICFIEPGFLNLR